MKAKKAGNVGFDWIHGLQLGEVGSQRTEVRGQKTDGGGLKDQQKTSNLPNPKASARQVLSCLAIANAKKECPMKPEDRGKIKIKPAHNRRY